MDLASNLSLWLHDIIFSGGIKKEGTWGGIKCASYVPIDLHILECTLWVLLLVFFVYQYNIVKIVREAMAIPTNLTFISFDYFLAAIHVALFLQVVYYKIHLRSLCYLLQPCHLALLWQGFVLIWSHPARLLLSAHAVVLLPGAVLALLYPATEGLDYYLESEAFFVQHYVLLLTPLYMLCRHNFLLLKQLSLPLLVFGNIISIVFHWLLYVHLDRYFQVNVNFFSCPSPGGLEFMKMIPSWLIWPTYRTFFTILAVSLSFVISYAYIGVIRCLQSVVHKRETKVE